MVKRAVNDVKRSPWLTRWRKAAALSCTLALASVGCAHGTWVMKPEGGARVGQWKHEVFSLGTFIVAAPLDLLGVMTNSPYESVQGMAADEGMLFVNYGTERVLLSARSGREVERIRALLPNGCTREECRFTWNGEDGVEDWPLGAVKPSRVWDVKELFSEEPSPPVAKGSQVAEHRLVIAALFPGKCRFVGIDTQSGEEVWRSEMDIRTPVGEGGVHALAKSGSMSYWEIGGKNAYDRRWEACVAVDAGTGDVLLNLPDWLWWEGSRSAGVHVNEADNTLTVLKRQQVTQVRRGSGEVVWRGEFALNLRPLGLFAVEGNRLFVEYEPWTFPGVLSGLYSYTRGSPAETQQVPVEARWGDVPLRGLAAIDLSSGKLLWSRTVTAADLRCDLSRICAYGHDATKEPPIYLEEWFTGAPEQTVGRLVIMRPITLFETHPSSQPHWHYLVGLDAATGKYAFVYRTNARRQIHGTPEITGFTTVDSAVCFGTRSGQVYGLDLSELAK